MRKKTECAPCHPEHQSAATIIDSLSAHIAIVDKAGVILRTNKAWQEFAVRTGVTGDTSNIGQNYLEICDATTGDNAQDAKSVAAGIRSVIRGEIDEFRYNYPCHGPAGQHWFYLRSIRVDARGPVQVIISHEEITDIKLAQEALQKSTDDLEKQKKNLEETNIALKVLLRQRDEDKQELEKKVLTNIKDLVFPYIEKLKRAPLRAKDRTNVEIIETHLNEVISPLLQRITHLNILLTPQEMQVAALVKDGKTSKEIAEVLNVSETTVHFHRKNLRNKFGIKKKATNLRSYLLSLS